VFVERKGAPGEPPAPGTAAARPGPPGVCDSGRREKEARPVGPASKDMICSAVVAPRASCPQAAGARSVVKALGKVEERPGWGRRTANRSPGVAAEGTFPASG